MTSSEAPDLLVIASLFSILCVCFFLAIWYQNRTLPGVDQWALVLVCETIAACLYPYKGILPDILTYPVSEICLMFALIFAVEGNRLFFDSPPVPSFKVLLTCVLIYAVFYSVAFFGFEETTLNYLSRTLGHCICWVVLCVPIVRLFFEQWKKGNWGPGLFVYSMTMALLTGLGVVYPLLIIYDYSYFTTANNILVIFTACLASFPMALGFSLLCFERKELILKNMRARALREVSEKNRMLNWLNHEVRTPIEAMTGHAGILADLYSNQPPLQHHCQVIRQSGDMLTEQLNYILTQQKNATIAPLEYRNIHLNVLVEELSGLLQPLAEAKNLTLTCQLSENLDKAYAMPDKDIRLVLINLLSNAIKYSDSGGVTLAVMAKGKGADKSDRVEFAVSDTGQGIAQRDQVSIFRPFFHINHKQKVSEGAGLGLAICQATLKRLGSNLKLKSVLGRGSRFSFVLTLTRVETDAPEQHYVPKSVLVAQRFPEYG